LIPATSAVMQLEMIGPYSDLDAVILLNRFHIAGGSSFSDNRRKDSWQ
jgi:hypothetical protein